MTESLLFQLLSYPIVTFSDSIKVSFSSSKLLYGNWFLWILPRESRICKIYFLWEWPRGLSVVDSLAWWMLSSGASGVHCRFGCTKFLGVQTFGSFKGFKWMGCVQNFKLFYQTFSDGERQSFFRNFVIRIIIKCSKNILSM